MEAFELYLLKSTVWLTGFGLIYLLFLRNERYFLLNRVYLISGLLASILFPLLNWHYTMVIPVNPSPTTFEPQLQIIAIAKPLISVRRIVQFLYISGIIYLIFRILKQTVSILRVIRKSGTQLFKSVKLIRTTDYPVSFSFFSFVFVNPSINDPETNEIVNHEREHVKQKHWIDLVLYELLCTLQWFNPMSWLYGHFIRQNHEYLADEQALQRTSNPALYRATLLNQMFGGSVISLAHSFNYSLNTKRFNMMKNKIYSPIRKLKLLLVLPLIASVFYAFAKPEYVYIETVSNSDASANLHPAAQSTHSPKDTVRILNETSNKRRKNRSVNVVVEVKKDQSDQNSEKKAEKEVIAIDNKGKQPLYVIDGVVKKNQNMNDILPDNIQSIDVWKGDKATEKYGDRAKNGVIEITMKQVKSSGTNYKAKGTTAFGYRLKNELGTNSFANKNAIIKFSGNGELQNNGNTDSKTKNKEIKIIGNEVHPLIVKDGVILENQEFKNIPPDNIASIRVWKGENATKKYGYLGINGVIEINTKQGKSFATDHIRVGHRLFNGNANSLTMVKPERYGVNDTDKHPLIIKDGVIAADQNVKAYRPDSIESVNIFRGKSATDKYGQKGKDGVIEITTKKK